MDFDNFIIGKTKERRGEIWQKKQQLLSKHKAAADGKNSKKTAALVSLLAENRWTSDHIYYWAYNRLLPHGWKTPADPPSNSYLTNIYMLTINKHRENLKTAGASCLLNLFRSRHKNKMQTICVLIKIGAEWGFAYTWANFAEQSSSYTLKILLRTYTCFQSTLNFSWFGIN